MKFTEDMWHTGLKRLVDQYFRTIVLVDLTEDQCLAVKDENGRWMNSREESQELRASIWLRKFMCNEACHPDDVMKYRTFTELDNLQRISSPTRFVYRKKQRDTYGRVVMEFVPETREDHQLLTVFVRDIKTPGGEDLNQVADVDRMRHMDAVTGLQNRICFEQDKKDAMGFMVGILWADLNGIKQANHDGGFEAGDKMLRDFAGLLIKHFRQAEVYRVGEDEFVVLIKNIYRENLENRFRSFYQIIQEREDAPLAAIGWAGGGDVDAVLKLAQVRMYYDKQEYYRQYRGQQDTEDTAE